MINYYPFENLGKADHGWLRANHHFSFARYYNPTRMGLGKLRVINDDWVESGTGFPSHPHSDMEIITFVRSGSVTHKDNMGNSGVTSAGEVQVMSAGTGIMHSEYNLSEEPLTLYQIWIEPNELGVSPRWETQTFENTAEGTQLPLLVSGYEEDRGNALFIHQEARIFGGQIPSNMKVTVPIKQSAYVLASKGSINILTQDASQVMNSGDGAEVTNTKELTIFANKDAEVIVIDVP